MKKIKEKICYSFLHKMEKKLRSLKQSSESKNEPLRDLSVNKCIYCPKIFYNSQFLLKHILRRHSDNLVMLYKKLLDVAKINANYSDLNLQKDLATFISNEFLKLRQELESMKLPISSFKEDPQCFHNNTYLKQQNNLNASRSKTVQDIDEMFKEIHSLKASVLKTESVVQDLETQCRERINSERVIKGDTIKESELFKNLRDNLVLEIRSMMSDMHNENNLILRKHFFDFEMEIKRLEQMIQLNSEKINNYSSLQEIEKKLLNEVQFFLKCNETKKEKNFPKKHSLLNISDLDKRKSAKNANVNHRKTIAVSTPNLSSMVHISENKEKSKDKASLECLNFEKSSLVSFESKDPLQDDPSRKTKDKQIAKFCKRISLANSSTNLSNKTMIEQNEKSKSFKEILKTQEIRNIEESLLTKPDIQKTIKDSELYDKVVSQLLEEKLNALGIQSGAERLSYHDFETKMKLVQLDTEMLSKECQSFMEVRQRLNSCVDDMVFLKVKAERPNKWNFQSLSDQVSPLKEYTSKMPKVDSNKRVTFNKNLTFTEPLTGELFDTKFPEETHSDLCEKRIVFPNTADSQECKINSNTVKNSAASLKLIKCTQNAQRKLPNFPLIFEEELSLCDSSFDSDRQI